MIFLFRYTLLRIESNSLFVYDRDYLLNSFSTPGGFIGWTGQFLTQFLHYPWIGAAIWIALVALTVRLVRMAYPGLCGTFWAVSYIPVVIQSVYCLGIGYGLFLMKSPGWFFIPSIGTLLILCTVVICQRIAIFPVRWFIIILSASVGYVLAGIWGPVSALTAALSCCKSTGRDYTGLVIALTGSIGLPVLLHTLYTTFRTDEIFTVGLPVISYESQLPVRLPCLLLILYMAVAPFIRISDSHPGTRKRDIIQMAVIVISAAIIIIFSYHDRNFATENAMSAALDRYEWKEVTDILEKAEKSSARSDERAYSRRTKSIGGRSGINDIESIVDRYSSRFYEPTRIMVLYKDIALFCLGTEAESMFSFRDGARKQKRRYDIPMAIQAGKQLYFYWGLPNYCHRWCIEESVEYGWSYSTLKYAAMSAISMEECDLARKYLEILANTLYYREWAESQLALIQDREAVSAAVPYNTVIPLMCYDDRLSNDQAIIEPFIMNHFTSHRPAIATPQFDRAAMLWALRTQDIQLFWLTFLNYLGSNNPKAIPRHYQEAAILYSNLERNSGIQSLPFDRQVRENYDAFVSYEKSHPVRSISESAYPYSKRFGKTFWFFYYFIRGQETF
ncbi:MAG: hypothetical protein J6T18_05845 [Bacteroidaceae bacterium]|nr:hypothetical protein [Bacteroidaceae bacterium]